MSRSWMLAMAAAACATALPVHTAELKAYADARYLAHEANDGDSFMVEFGGEGHMIRLYYADALETTLGSPSDRRRALDQARHFGVPAPQRVTPYGAAARDRVRDLLGGSPFTVHSAMAHAPGRSRRPRVYAMVTLPDGRDLAAVLVSEGLARARGVRRARPDGTSGEEYAAFLADLELAAALGTRGLWTETEPDKLADLRRQQREDDRLLDIQAFGVFATLNEDDPLDLNTAPAEELQQIKGIGEALAERIIAHRPFASVDDLRRVPGIGPTLVERARPFLTAEPVE